MAINKYQIKAPTEVITTTLGIPEDYKQQCIQEAYRICDTQNLPLGYTSIMSSYWVWRETDVYNSLFDKAIYEVQNILYPLKNNEYKYKLNGGWVAIYKDGHYATPHAHDPDYLSFVYYLKANSGSAPLVFDGCDFQVQPHDDLLVVFPSYLKHSVPKQVGEDRICVVGNMQLVANSTPT